MKTAKSEELERDYTMVIGQILNMVNNADRWLVAERRIEEE